MCTICSLSISKYAKVIINQDFSNHHGLGLALPLSRGTPRGVLWNSVQDKKHGSLACLLQLMDELISREVGNIKTRIDFFVGWFLFSPWWRHQMEIFSTFLVI